MKLTGVCFLTFSTMALLAAESAFAQEPRLPGGEKTFSRADKDGDGKVTAAELAPRAEKRFMRLDADKDGVVTRAEVETWLAAIMERRRDRIMEGLDADGDGRITAAELKASLESLAGAADTDKDGGVTLAEARAYYAEKRKEYFARQRLSRSAD